MHVAGTIDRQRETLPKKALWNFRLGHRSSVRVKPMHNYFPSIVIDEGSVCDIFQYARKNKLPYFPSKCYEMNQFDIWGPISTPSVHGHKYFLIALDDYNRYIWDILLKSRSELSNHVKYLITMLENQNDTKIKTIRTDNEPELLIPHFYASKGIIHQTSCLETPGQNGRVERKHQHILNVGRALLF